MEILYNPFFTKEAFFTHDLWDTVVTGDAGLLEQLLMRADTTANDNRFLFATTAQS